MFLLNSRVNFNICCIFVINIFYFYTGICYHLTSSSTLARQRYGNISFAS